MTGLAGSRQTNHGDTGQVVGTSEVTILLVLPTVMCRITYRCELPRRAPNASVELAL